jgi:hypothetical protein
VIGDDLNTGPPAVQKRDNAFDHDVQFVIDVAGEVETKLVTEFIEVSSFAPAGRLGCPAVIAGLRRAGFTGGWLEA